MTATATVSTTSARSVANPSSNRQVRRSGAVSGVVASAATVGVAGAAQAIGVPIEIAGQSIPLLGFAQLTLVAALIGVVTASIMARRAVHARHAFVSTALALTALSFLPGILANATTATKLTLVVTHVVAAAIIIPALASRLAD